MSKRSWFRTISLPTVGSLDESLPSENNCPSIVWLPHAGGGPASLTRAARRLAPLSTPLELRGGLLPGREDRFPEPFETSMSRVVETLAEELADQPPRPLVLVGHSFGSLVAYRVAQTLTRRGRRPTGLIVMAMGSPDRFSRRPERLELDDEAFADELDREFGGIPAALRSNPAALNLFLPIVRADLRLMESFDNPADHAMGNSQTVSTGEQTPLWPTLTCPVRAICGTSDPVADQATMIGWRNVTSGSFTLRVWPGDHFFPIEQFERVLRVATELLDDADCSGHASQNRS